MVLLERPQLEATLRPDGPVPFWTYPEPSSPSDHVHRLAQRVSNVSVIPVGGLIDLPEVAPKKPTTTSPGTVAVTEGAMGNLVLGVKAPLWVSIGVVRSTFLKSRTPPVTDDPDPRVQP
jgi:hypothetical protein